MKRHSIVLSFVFLMISTSSFAQFWKNLDGIKPSGEIVESTKLVNNFSKIDISSAFEVELVHSNKNKISIHTDKAFLPHIVTKIKGSTLYVNTLKHLRRKDNDIPLHITIYAQDIKAIKLTGASTLNSKDVWHTTDLYLQCSGASEIDITTECDTFEAKLSGASDIDLQLQCKNSHITISGASELELEGSTDNAFFKISGASDVDANRFRALCTEATVSGASEVYIYASERLNVSASGVSKVTHSGNARNTKIKCNSLSNVRKK